MVVEIIAKYLESNKRLIIPNFGAFMVKVPQQTILFSNLLKGDDGVLRKLLSEAGMSEIEAAGVVDRFVFEINYRLQCSGECLLRGFGRLSTNANGAITFEYAPATEAEDLVGALESKQPAAQSVESVASSVNVAADMAESVALQAASKPQEQKPAPAVEPKAKVAVEEEQEDVEIEVTPRAAAPRPAPQRVRRTEVVYDNQRVSATAKMRPDDYVKGLRYGKGRKIVSGRESAMTRRSNKSDLIMKIAIGAALIAIAALAYGMWNDWRASRLDAEIYGEVPASAESTVRNPDLDYIQKQAE